MKNQGTIKVLLKLSLLSLPIMLLTAYYVIDDPFKVIKSYDTYYRAGCPNYVGLNRDYVSTETFLRHHDEMKWDSFIFGNSRSIFYEVNDWAAYIDSDRTFHFDASGESIYGIMCKLRLMERRGTPVRNALIVLDVATLREVNNSKGHLFLKHPLLSGQSWITFELEYLKTFFSSRFLVVYLDFKLSHKIKPYMIADDIMDNRHLDYYLQHNEIHYAEYEELIHSNPDAYYKHREAVFSVRPATLVVSPSIIHEPQNALLREISRMLNSQKTNLRIVISPLYDQKKFNPADLAYLKDLFGEDRVYDFSGINDITNDKFNYYEPSHYRPHIARKIIALIYGTRG